MFTTLIISNCSNLKFNSTGFDAAVVRWKQSNTELHNTITANQDGKIGTMPNLSRDGSEVNFIAPSVLFINKAK